MLIVDLARPVRLEWGRGRAAELSPGHYLYVGSAYGPGGLRARLARHFRTEKRPHWHIDRLLAVADPIGALAVPGGRECALAARLRAGPPPAVPIAGFGASDCRCETHLFAAPESSPESPPGALDPKTLTALIAGR